MCGQECVDIDDIHVYTYAHELLETYVVAIRLWFKKSMHIYIHQIQLCSYAFHQSSD